MPRLVVMRGNNKGEVIKLSSGMKPIVFGRLLDCEFTIHDNLVSRRHFSIHYEGESFVVIDLDSHNGTFHNGRRLEKPVPLHPGDRIQAGISLFFFDEGEADERGGLVGRKLGPYRCIRRLGVGGMGEVYLAQQLTLGRKVAIKILYPDKVQEESQTRRFIDEARHAGKLDHPNVIHVYDVGEFDGMYCYSMELVSGGSVEDLIAGGKRLAPLAAVELLLEAAEALRYAERQGIIHCDVKPANLMLTRDGHIRLADLGISKRIGEMGKADQAEGVYGSPHYMSPEQCKGEDLDAATDQYSLGVVAYRMLSGRFPFDGTTAQGIMEKHVFDTLVGLDEAAPDMPALLATIVNRMLEKDPAKRFPSFKEVISELRKAKRAIHRGEAPPSRIVRVDKKKLRKSSILRRSAPWLAVILAVLAAVYWYIQSKRDIDEQGDTGKPRVGEIRAAKKPN